MGESKIWSLYDRAKFLGNKFLIKIMSVQGTDLHNLVIRLSTSPYWNNLLSNSRSLLPSQIKTLLPYIPHLKSENNFPSFLINFDVLCSTADLNTELGINLKNSPDPNAIFLDYSSSKPPNSISFFTDGSRDHVSETVGAAFFSPELNITNLLSLNKYTSIFTAECIAIRGAVDYASRLSYDNVFIYSDCLSALYSLASCSFKTTTNLFILEIKEIFYKCTQHSIRFFFFWIPAHIGITPNKKVDKLAKEASRLDITSDLVPYTDLTSNFRTLAIAESNNQLLKQAKHKETKYFNHFYFSNSHPWYYGKPFQREFISLVNRLRANHYQLAASLFRINLAPSPECQCGYPEQDPNHIIWQCPLYNLGRRDLITNLCTKGYYPPYTIDTFLFQPNIAPLLCIHKFLKKHNLYL